MITLPKTLPERIAAAFLAVLWIVCVYRAATQSIVHDEALTWQLYLATPFNSIFQVFDANHHFLNTLLMRFSTTILGFSGLAMRLPALLGAAIFFVSLYRFCRWALGATWLLTIAAAAVALNPFILDFMVAARGYGLALAFWMAAVAFLAPQLESPIHDRKAVLIAGACAAFSVTANLIFVQPVAILAVLVIWYSIRRPKAAAASPSKKENAPPKKRRAEVQPAQRGLWFDFFLPAAIIAVVFLLSAPLENAESRHFYTGAPSLALSLHSLAESTVAHGGAAAFHSFAMKATDAVAFIFAPLVLLAGLVAAIRWRNLALMIISVSACGSAILVCLMHLALDFPYPADRTGIYFIAFVSLTIAAALAIPNRAVQSSAAAIALLMLACFAIQFETRYFSVWIYDAETDQIAARFADFARAKPAATFANSWVLEPALNFYRQTRHYDQLSPFTRQPLSPGNDYYAIDIQDQDTLRDLGLKIVYRGPASGTVIAVPGTH